MVNKHLVKYMADRISQLDGRHKALGLFCYAKRQNKMNIIAGLQAPEPMRPTLCRGMCNQTTCDTVMLYREHSSYSMFELQHKAACTLTAQHSRC